MKNYEKWFKNKLHPNAENLIHELDFIRHKIQNTKKVCFKTLFDENLVKRLLELDEFNLQYVAQSTVGARRSAEFKSIISNWGK